MINRKRNILIALLVAIFVFAIPDFAEAISLNPAAWAESILGVIGDLILRLTALITHLGGLALNASIYYTVIHMSENFGQIEPAVNEAWVVIRDVANMGFIFVLLWASIQLILGVGKDTQRLIVNMVIAAILINFSLFFTKVVIDVANILAITFYDVIAPGAGADFLAKGLSNSMMQALNVSSILEPSGTLSGSNVFILAILSSIVLLISAFVFFAAAIMFIVRYVVLIFVLILSPIAFVSNVLPGLSDTAKKWKDALVGQAFFAPIYFLLMIVTIKVAQGISGTVFGNSSGLGSAFSSTDLNAPAALINFGVIIAFLITSLVVAKGWADKAPGAVGKMTKWAMGAAGGLTAGTAAWAGRKSLGAAGAAIGESEFLKRNAYNADGTVKSGYGAAMSRLGLAASRKASKATFDARGTSFYENLSGATDVSFGKAGGKGGYAEEAKKRAKEQKEFGESLKPSDLFMNQIEEENRAANLELLEAKKSGDSARIDAATTRAAAAKQRLEHYKGVDKDGIKKKKEGAIENAPETKKVTELEDAKKKKEEELSKALSDGEKDAINEELKKLNEEIKTAKDAAEKAKKDIELDYDLREARGEFMSQADVRKRGYAQHLEDPRIFKSPLNVAFVHRGDRQAAAELRKGKKPVKDQLEAILREAGDIPKKDENAEGGGGEGEGGGDKDKKEGGEAAA